MNEKNIQTVAMEEIWKQNTDGHIPVLLEIFNPDIKWKDGSLEQENMYLRVIDDSNPVMYKGKKYLSAKFEYTPPDEDGKTVGNASITLSAIDSRVVQMLRSIELQCDVTVMAAFAKITKVTETGEEKVTYRFYPLDQLKARMPSASYNRTTAQLSLTYKDALKLNVPRDIATKDKLPSVNANA
jgi:hypothetical protein